MIIYYNYPILKPTVSATAQEVDHEVERLIDDDPRSTFESTVLSETIIIFTFSQTQLIRGIILLNHNLINTDNCIFEASEDNFNTISDTLPVSLTGSNNTVIELGDWTYQYYRLRITKNSGQYIQIGEIYLYNKAFDLSASQFNYNIVRQIERKWNNHTSSAGRLSRNLKYKKIGYQITGSGIRATIQDTFDYIADNAFVVLYYDNNFHHGAIDLNGFSGQGLSVSTTATFTPSTSIEIL